MLISLASAPPGGERSERVNGKLAIDSCQQFFISHFKRWSQGVTKKEIEYLLGLRTRERDLLELDRKTGTQNDTESRTVNRHTTPNT